MPDSLSLAAELRAAVHAWIREDLDAGAKMLVGFHSPKLIDRLTRAAEALERGAGEDKGVSRDHDQTIGSALEGYPVEPLLDALAAAETLSERTAREHISTSRARAFCQGRANAFREAWELVLRHRSPAAPSSAKPSERDSSRDTENPPPQPTITQAEGR